MNYRMLVCGIFAFSAHLVFAQEVRSIVDSAAVHSTPSEAAPVVGHLPKGQRAFVTEEAAGFSKLRSRSRRDLWTKKSNLRLLDDGAVYDLARDVEPLYLVAEPDFKRVRLDFGGSGGTEQSIGFLEVALGVEYFMMERLSLRNAVFYRRSESQSDFFGLDTSVRGNGRLPLGALRLRGIIGAGYRFAGNDNGAPLVEVGGFAAIRGFDVGVMLKYLHYRFSDSSRSGVVIYSVVFSGTAGFF
jgi:hypothetical protein